MLPVKGRIELDFRISSDLTAPRNARRCLDRLSPHIDENLLDDVRFLVNELVTNSIQHACKPGEWIGLAVAGDCDCVRVEVSDPGPGFEPVPKKASPEDTSGRGLFLVDSMADQWGVERDEATRVWFEMRPQSVSA